MGRVASPGQHLKQWVEEAGFENVTHTVIKLPFGTWPRDKSLVRLHDSAFAYILKVHG